MNILIADDNEDVRTLHETILESLGHTVESAEDGLQALKLAKYSRPDMIISDIMMPEMDGFELCRTIKNDTQLKTIPFIFYTATFTEPGDKRLAMALGASEFIVKPTEPDDFIDIINGVIEEHRQKKLRVPDRASNAGKTLGHMHNERLTRKLDKKVSDLEEKNRALQESEQKYRRLVEGLQSDYIFYAFDTDGAFTYISPSVNDVLGYPQDDFFNNYREYFTDNPINRNVAAHTKLSLKGEKSPAYEMEMYHKDGTIRSFEVTEVPILDERQRVIAVEGIARDITIQKKAEMAVEKSNRALRTLSGCNEALVHATDEMQLLDELCRIIVDTGGYRLAWVGYMEGKEEGSIRPVAQAGLDGLFREDSNITWLRLEQCSITPAANSARPVVIQDIFRDCCCDPCHEEAKSYGYRSVFVFPLITEGKVLGVFSIYADGPDAFGEEETKLLTELGGDLAFGIETLRTRAEHKKAEEQRKRSAEELHTALIQTVQAMGLTMEKRDPYTAGHQQRVAELAVAIAQELGLPDEKIEGILLGAMIHDIGKLCVPAEILNRPGQLTDAEFAIIKSHPQVGYDIIKDVDFPWPVSKIISQHHEHLDGSGYPNGLKEDDIILEARILAVADVMEAMASHRPYRPSLGIDVALKAIKENRGTFYDPDVVDACLRLIEEKRFRFDLRS